MTTNAFGLPYRIARGAAADSGCTTARFLSANRVLIVDGDAEATELLATLLRLSNPSITTMAAHTAHAAVVLASEYRPDVAIVDLGTQAMSGEVIAGGVLSACANARPLMIALSGGGFGRSEARLRRVFDHVLTKPVELANLVSLVTRRPTLVQPGRS
jgi:DNA-binding response OmpR family regulator